MLRIKQEYFCNKPTVRETARNAGVEPETLSRIINGKQAPGYGEGQSAERIARAVGWTGDVRALFEEATEVPEQAGEIAGGPRGENGFGSSGAL